jgi:GNAT superfamily N-acetyltransferase
MNALEIIDTNADNIYNYKLCFYKDAKQEGYRLKAEWLKQRFSEGLKYKLLYSADEGALATIEYVPGEYTWRAAEASGYMMIHCIFSEYKKYRGQGYGTLLVEESVKDAKKGNMHGVAVVTRKGVWMVGKELFLKNGFKLVDTAPPDFELLAKQFDDSPPPRFDVDWGKRLSKYSPGLTIIRSDQCPYITKSVREITETAKKKYGITPNIAELKNCKDAQNAPSPFAVFGIVYDGKLVADHPISNTRFMNIMEKELKRRTS